jgi:hypothetical protein
LSGSPPPLPSSSPPGSAPIIKSVSRSSLLDHEDWFCYVGRIGFPDAKLDLTNEPYLSILYLRDYVVNNNDPFYLQTIFSYILQPSTGSWTVDPTHGYQKYPAGCNDEDILVKEEQGGGFSTNVALGFWTPNWMKDHTGRRLDWTWVSDTGENTSLGFSPNSPEGLNFFPIEALRYESSDTFENGVVAVVKMRHVPNGTASWPAVWMLGTPDVNAWRNKNGIGSTWPYGGAGEIDFFEALEGSFASHPFSQKSQYDSYRFQTLHTPPTCFVNMYLGDTLQTTNGPVECNRQTLDGSTTCDKDTGAGCINNGCGIPINMEDANYKDKEYTYVFEYSRKEGRVVTYSFPTDPSNDVTLEKVLQSEGSINSDLHTEKLTQIEGVKWAKHILHHGCEGVFENMHFVINTAICGDWAGKSSEDTDTVRCQEIIRDDFLTSIDPDYQAGQTIPDPGKQTQYPNFWNTNTSTSRNYKFDFASFQYKSL